MKLAFKRAGLGFMIMMGSLGILSCGSHHAHHGHAHERILKKVSKRLDLNPAQQAQFREVLNTMTVLKQELKSNHMAMVNPLKANLAQPELNLDELNGQLDQLESEFHDFRKAFMAQYSEFHASLTDDQRGKLVLLLEKLEKHHRD